MQLEYGSGRAMKAEPVNLGMLNVANYLECGETVVVELEPGDGTYYSLLLVPCWAEGVANYLDRWGITAEGAHKYLMVVKLEQEGSHAVWIPMQETIQEHHVAHLSTSAWSQRLFAWWFGELFEVMGVRRPKQTD